MFHEELSDEIVLIAQSGALHLSRCQQEAGVFDAARGKNNDFGCNPEFPTLQTTYANTGDDSGCIACLDLDSIGIQVGIDVARVNDRIPVDGTEVSRRTMLNDRCDDTVVWERQAARVAGFPIFDSIGHG